MVLISIKIAYLMETFHSIYEILSKTMEFCLSCIVVFFCDFFFYKSTQFMLCHVFYSLKNIIYVFLYYIQFYIHTSVDYITINNETVQ